MTFLDIPETGASWEVEPVFFEALVGILSTDEAFP
jgi:hypothetical protein